MAEKAAFLSADFQSLVSENWVVGGNRARTWDPLIKKRRTIFLTMLCRRRWPRLRTN
jgi:hypothetical protein